MTDGLNKNKKWHRFVLENILFSLNNPTGDIKHYLSIVTNTQIHSAGSVIRYTLSAHTHLSPLALALYQQDDAGVGLLQRVAVQQGFARHAQLHFSDAGRRAADSGHGRTRFLRFTHSGSVWKSAKATRESRQGTTGDSEFAKEQQRRRLKDIHWLRKQEKLACLSQVLCGRGGVTRRCHMSRPGGTTGWDGSLHHGGTLNTQKMAFHNISMGENNLLYFCMCINQENQDFRTL